MCAEAHVGAVGVMTLAPGTHRLVLALIDVCRREKQRITFFMSAALPRATLTSHKTYVNTRIFTMTKTMAKKQTLVSTNFTPSQILAAAKTVLYDKLHRRVKYKRRSS